MLDRKSTRLNSSHLVISYAVFCLKKKKAEKNKDSLAGHIGPAAGTPPRQASAAHKQRTVASKLVILWLFFFFNDTATTEIYTLSLHDALPIWHPLWVQKLYSVVSVPRGVILN